jgi:hypothetical protein
MSTPSCAEWSTGELLFEKRHHFLFALVGALQSDEANGGKLLEQIIYLHANEE